MSDLDWQWFVIRSSHAVRFFSRGNAPKALCGKWGKIDAEILEQRPDGKSCESCLRIIATASDAR